MLSVSPSIRALIFCGVSFAALAACDTAEERAEKHFQSGMELVAAGDVDRALVEFRNVFNLNGTHEEARATYARLVLEQGNVSEAFSQYLLLVEQHPNHAEGRSELARLAILSREWDQAERHTSALEELTPDAPDVRVYRIAIDYQAAVSGNDMTTADGIAERAETELDAQPENLFLHRIVIDSHLRRQNLTSGLEAIDMALAIDEADPELNGLRLQVLSALGDGDGVGEQLRNMLSRDPDAAQLREALLRWYLVRDDIDGAEAFLASEIDRLGDDPAPRVNLIQFTRRFRSDSDALALLDTYATGDANPELFQSLRATLKYELGDRDAALSEMETLVAGLEDSEEARNIKMTLARMRQAEGNEVGARQIVEDILAADGNHVEALKMKAGWLIDDDQPGEAILLMRTALDASPRNASVMTLMARAHEREGSRALTGERLALAVEFSNNAPEESLTYTRFLIQDEKYLAAETVLIDALRLAPGNVRLLEALGSTYLAIEDWSRARQVIETLKNFNAPEPTAIAANLETQLLARQNRTDETLELLTGLIAQGQGGSAAKLSVVQTHLENNDMASARRFLDDLLSEDPDSPDLRMMDAALTASAGDRDGALAAYRDLVTDYPQSEQVWRAMIALHMQAGDSATAERVLDESLAALPNAANLQWMKAGLLEQRGDIDGAIGIYETLYEANSSAVVIANNLASLLSTYKTDPAALERAYVVGRRLQGTRVPAFQDTYGWLMYLQGNYEEAEEYLASAAAALVDDPNVQYHLAKTYVALERPTDALPVFERARALWPEGAERASETEAEIARLSALIESQN